jgi:hypothetical protein
MMGSDIKFNGEYDGQKFGSKMKMKQYVYEMFDKMWEMNQGGYGGAEHPLEITQGNQYYGKLFSLLQRHPDYNTLYNNRQIFKFTYKSSTTGPKKVYELVLNEDEKVPWNECITQKKKKATEKKEKVCESCGAKL